MCSRSFSRDHTLRSELLARFPMTSFNDCGVSLPGAELVEFLRGHDRAIVALERVDEALLTALPELAVISKYGVGLDGIDLDAMRLHGRRLGWTPGVNKRSVAELALAAAIALLRHVPAANAEVRSGVWRQHIGGCLTGRTVGIIGCGNVGQDLVRLLEPFRCRILVRDIREYPEFYAAHHIEAVELDDLLEQADVVSLHVPLTVLTAGMLDRSRLARLKPSAILINTARGGLVDEVAVREMLEGGQLAGAAFDVLQSEPPSDLTLCNLPNVLVTPHIGGSAREAILAMGRAAIDGLEHNDVPGPGLG